MNRGRMMNEHEAHERDMQWDDAGDGAGLPETGERDAVQGIEPGAERHAAEYKAVALGDAVAADAAGTATSVIGNVPVPTAAEGKTEPAAQEGPVLPDSRPQMMRACSSSTIPRGTSPT